MNKYAAIKFKTGYDLAMMYATEPSACRRRMIEIDYDIPRRSKEENESLMKALEPIWKDSTKTMQERGRE